MDKISKFYLFSIFWFITIYFYPFKHDFWLRGVLGCCVNYFSCEISKDIYDFSFKELKHKISFKIFFDHLVNKSNSDYVTDPQFVSLPDNLGHRQDATC